MSYYWVPLSAECRLSCAGLENSLGVLASISACKCRPGCLWNPNTLACVLMCDSVTNANGAVNATACACKAGYKWMGDNTCQPIPPW